MLRLKKMQKIKIVLLIFSIIFILGCQEEVRTADLQTVVYQVTGQEELGVIDDQVYIDDRQLTFDEYQNYSPTWIPGTKKIVYLSKQDQYTKFFWLDPSNLEIEFITATKGDPQDLLPSPKKSLLLYTENNYLYLLDLSEEVTIKIDSQATLATWSPYGDALAYLKDGETIKYTSLNKQNKISDSKELYQGEIISIDFYNKQNLTIAENTESGYNSFKLNINSSL